MYAIRSYYVPRSHRGNRTRLRHRLNRHLMRPREYNLREHLVDCQTNLGSHIFHVFTTAIAMVFIVVYSRCYFLSLSAVITLKVFELMVNLMLRSAFEM